MQVDRLLNELTGMLLKSHGDHARPYAERILLHQTSLSRTQLYTGSCRELTMPVVEECRRIATRCSAGEPLEYVTGVAYFYNREFAVSPAVLIPRPDTEILIETVLAHERSGNALFADLGCGSGCIGSILTGEHPQWKVLAIDISADAVGMTKRNRCSDRVLPLCADRFTAVRPDVGFDFIVSNPPYIPASVIPSLESSVRLHEPHGALDGGEDGLDFYRYLAVEAQRFLVPGGALYCEIGFDQGESVPALFSTPSWRDASLVKDLSGHPRVFHARSTGRETE